MANITNPADDPTSGYVVVNISGGKALLFHEGRCVECESCIAVCPNEVFQIVSFFGETRLVPTVGTLSKCCGCFKCVEACLTGALRQQ
ncbi:MAG: 4Fe-4S dicluster domain-containing protein [Campylobacteraceae bacterium]|jgi:formate hydrogenlyase subunit 6/NADH:ubiquinone oxidoreductase subunit I|nr:4Fe-4S dicluster domain-containing protein [Campylobacteraceae bacterium]